MAKTFSPEKTYSSGHQGGIFTQPDQQPAGSSPASKSSGASSLSALSPSILNEKCDEEIEACLAGTQELNEDSGVSSIAQKEDTMDIPFPSNCDAMEDEVQSTPTNQMGTADSKDADSVKADDLILVPGHYPQAANPNMPWTDLWSQMRKSGWAYKPGSGLVPWYWIHADVAKMKKSNLLSKGTEGVHYFTSEQDIHRYAMQHLGWVGEGMELSPVPSDSDMSLTSRVKKRAKTNNMEETNLPAPSPLKRSRGLPKDDNETAGGTSTQPSPAKKQRASPRTNGKESAKSPEASDSASKKGHLAPPDKQSAIKDKLECCQMVLHANFNKNQLSKSAAKSVVSSKEDDIMDFMTKSIETGMSVDGMTIPSPGFMYICGGPGTGKVSVSKLVTFFLASLY